MKIKITLSVITILFFLFLNELQATESQGQIEITALINEKPVAAVVKINKSRDRNYAYWSMYQPGGPTLATPLSVSLPPGNYFLHVKPLGIHSPVNERVIPFKMSANSHIVKKLDFPVGRLKITASEENSGKKIDALVYIKQGWRQVAPPQGRTLHTPTELVMSPGQYKVKSTKTEDKQSISKNITVRSGETAQLNLKFKSSHFGYLAIDIDMNGKVLPFKQYSQYGRITLYDSRTHREIHALSGGYGQPYQLKSGRYEIQFHSFIVGENDITLENILITDNSRISKKIHIQQPAEIKINAQWAEKSKSLIKCLRSKNPFDSQRLGTLFGGPGGSAGGKCFDNNINGLITEVISVNDNNRRTIRKKRFFVKPGLYKIKVWPYDHKYLTKTVGAIELRPGSIQQKKLKFRWPFVEKKVKVNNKTFTKLERKTPLGEGYLQLAATINGQPTNSRAQFGVSKLDYKGQESSGLFRFFTKEYGSPIGLKLPLKKLIPAGSYHAYVEPFGPHLILEKQRFDFYMDAGSNINKVINFKTGQLKITQSEKNNQVNKLRAFITKGDNISVLHRYHQNTLPLDVQITPGSYQVKLYTPRNLVYFSKKITIREGKQTEIIIP